MQFTEKTKIYFFVLNICFLFFFNTPHTPHLSLSFFSVVYCHSSSQVGGVEPLKTSFTVRTSKRGMFFLFLSHVHFAYIYLQKSAFGPMGSPAGLRGLYRTSAVLLLVTVLVLRLRLNPVLDPVLDRPPSGTLTVGLACWTFQHVQQLDGRTETDVAACFFFLAFTLNKSRKLSERVNESLISRSFPALTFCVDRSPPAGFQFCF